MVYDGYDSFIVTYPATFAIFSYKFFAPCLKTNAFAVK